MICLRLAKEEDLPIIKEIAYNTWPTTYGDIISSAQIDYMLDMMYNQAKLITQLKEGHQFIIADNDGLDIGFAGYQMLDGDVCCLHKLYVLPNSQGEGVGKILMDAVVDKCYEAKVKYLQLNVNRDNKAFEFYKKCGFIIKETVDLNIGNGFFMNDYVMLKVL